MVDSVSTNPCSPSFPVRDVAMIPDLPIFLRSCKIKSAYSTIMHFSEMINPLVDCNLNLLESVAHGAVNGSCNYEVQYHYCSVECLRCHTNVFHVSTSSSVVARIMGNNSSK